MNEQSERTGGIYIPPCCSFAYRCSRTGVFACSLIARTCEGVINPGEGVRLPEIRDSLLACCWQGGMADRHGRCPFGDRTSRSCARGVVPGVCEPASGRVYQIHGYRAGGGYRTVLSLHNRT